jgi:ubiquitin-like protein ATG12
MTASTVLMSLPRDATAALAAAGGFPFEKVVIRFRPVGAAPAIRQQRVKVLSTQKFEDVVVHVRNRLKVANTDSVFLYINNTFAPALDEVVGNLWRVSATCVQLGDSILNDDCSASKTPTTNLMCPIP